MSYKISVDTGGTFTDVVVSDKNGNKVIGKSLTTHGRVFDGISSGLKVAAELLGISDHSLLSEAELLIYGTTRATNAIVEKKTAKTAFLTTAGFPDILVLREGGRTNAHNFTYEYPEPYIPKSRTFEIAERINAEGGIELPLEEASSRAILIDLKRGGYEAIAVCLLWSIANPSHELALEKLIQEIMPGVPYTLSHQLLPIVREYRRASATSIDASLKPLMQSHLRQMEADLRESGFNGDLLVSSSVGGCISVESAINLPIKTAKSGPAMAPVAAKHYNKVESFGGNAIVCDTGGTTFDVGLVRDGDIVFTRDTWLGGQYVGHIIATSTVDIRSLGAGGGSIAWIDKGGLLQVGPQSAGSEPGPACYGRGGTFPTVTDAAAVLGFLDPKKFLGGRMSLDVVAARTSISTVAEPLGKSVDETAWAILKITDELMVKAIHEITVAEGFNPRESSIVAGGGAAGLNIMCIAAELGVENVVLPNMAGALSAVGMQYADIVSEESGSLVTTTSNFDYEGVNSLLSEMKARLDSFVSELGGESELAIAFFTYIEARYLGQVWEIDVELPINQFKDREDVESLVSAFHKVHERIYAVIDLNSAVECLNWKMRVAIKLEHTEKKFEKSGLFAAAVSDRTRQCYFGSGSEIQTPIYYGSDLKPGACVKGPAVIEEPTTTLVVYPEMEVQVSDVGNYLLKVMAH